MLGFYKKLGAQEQMIVNNITAVVADTKATMVAAGRHFVEHSSHANGTTK
jgi:hypothetical protein